ncbi:tautomerase family protein [Streptomyces europaeiscabiei]|uniref:tautomerase family protein n=1 Tax=Streptomyces europaeiscabiei TaxID=146819 RepID=UPI0006285546|nr:tautomerase family protein [Streptomyces europaeiscabiei]MDX2758418.1 tautomerase family protein [Streptomyces europaeiscabiei]MDX2770312.1 tautomerase family protein [Streptomyces europaeiscabiei]
MPQVAITIAEGRTPAQLRDLIHEVHAAVLRTVNTRPEYIRVVVHEVPRTHWATGDVTLTEMDAAGPLVTAAAEEQS